MRKGALLAVGVMLAAAIALGGCDVVSDWIDELFGGGTSGGFTAARIAFSLQGNVARNDVQAQATVIETQELAAVFQASGAYNELTRTFVATWDGGDFSGTHMEIRLNATEEYVEHFEVRQTRVHTFGAWTEVYEIAGHDVLFLADDGPDRLFLVDGPATSVIVDAIEYREWPKNVGTASEPYYRLVPPQLANIWSDASSYVEIRLDR